MKVAKPNRVERSYRQKLEGSPSQVLPLLCPVREADWIEGWDPRIVYSESGVAEPDCVFITESEEHGESIWYVTRQEPEEGLVEMVKITPGVTACRLTIRVWPSGEGSEADVTYSHTSLGPEGDRFLETFTEEYYESFMKEWESSLNEYLVSS